MDDDVLWKKNTVHHSSSNHREKEVERQDDRKSLTVFVDMTDII